MFSKIDREPPTEGEITKLLDQIRQGDSYAANQLMEAVYGRIRQIVERISNTNGLPLTLTPTDVLHDSFMKIVSSKGFCNFQNRGHLYGTFATTVRNVIIDYARMKKTDKRGGKLQRIEFDLVLSHFEKQNDCQFLELAEALDRLATVSPRAAKLVDIRFFGGFSIEEAAEILGVSVATANTDWRYARAYLSSELDPLDG